MKTTKFTEIQIVKILGDQEQGKSVSNICSHFILGTNNHITFVTSFVHFLKQSFFFGESCLLNAES